MRLLGSALWGWATGHAKFATVKDLSKTNSGLAGLDPHFGKKLNRKKVESLLSHLKSEANWVEPRFRLDITKADPEDSKFLECAQGAKADFLITGNKKHFPPKAFKGTLILNPTEFLYAVAKQLD